MIFSASCFLDDALLAQHGGVGDGAGMSCRYSRASKAMEELKSLTRLSVSFLKPSSP